MSHQLRAGSVSLVIVLSTMLTGAMIAAPAAAAPTVTVDSPTAVSPGETTTITITGTETSEVTFSGDLEGWVLNSSDPSGLTTHPSPGDTPYTGQANDSWGHIFGSVGENAWELTMTAPDAPGEYAFTANVTNDDGESSTETVTVTVADPAVDAPAADHVTPGTETEITVNGTNVDELGLQQVPDGWTVVSQRRTDENGTTLVSNTNDSAANDTENGTWVASFDGVQSNASYTATVVASADEGTYQFAAVGSDGDAADVENFTVEVASVVVYEDRVAPGEVTEMTIGGHATSEVSLEGGLHNWTVTDTDPGTLTTVPAPGDLPYTGVENDTWGHVFAEEGDNAWALSVRAPNETGNYTFTAETSDDAGETKVQTFVVTVAEPPAEHESGVEQRTFEAVDQDDDDELSANDLRATVRSYVSNDGTVGDVDLTATELRKLVAYYVQS